MVRKKEVQSHGSHGRRRQTLIRMERRTERKRRLEGLIYANYGTTTFGEIGQNGLVYMLLLFRVRDGSIQRDDETSLLHCSAGKTSAVATERSGEGGRRERGKKEGRKKPQISSPK